MHDPTKQLMGVNGSSCKNVSPYDSDPATFKAGLACRLKSDGKLSLVKADGGYLGVSMGESLSDTKKTSVAHSGLDIPILLTDDSDDYAYVVVGQPVYISDSTGMAIDSGEANVTVANAQYSSLPLDAVNEKGEVVGKCAKIDFVGGL